MIIVIINFLIICTSISFVNGQNPNPPIDSYIGVNSSGNFVFVSLPDTVYISEIEVSIGNKGISSNIFNHTYYFDQTLLLNGLSYARSGMDLYLGIGTISLPSAFKVQVRLKNASGNWSSWYEYISN